MSAATWIYGALHDWGIFNDKRKKTNNQTKNIKAIVVTSCYWDLQNSFGDR